MLNFQNKGADFKRDLLSDVQDIVVRAMSSVSATFAAQQNGLVVSDQHRVLNFLGAGVTLTDDPTSRRTNITIPGGTAGTIAGAPITSNTSTVHVKTLWNGASNDTPPANWYTSGFTEDGTWTVPVTANNTPSDVPSGTTPIWKTATYLNSTEANLFRQSVTVTGTVASAILVYDADGFIEEFRINGTVVATKLDTPSGQAGTRSVSITPSLLVPGSSNQIGMWVLGSLPNFSWAAWRLSITYSTSSLGPYVRAEDQKTSTTDGGGFTSGSWQTRTLNTLTDDTGGIASLASNQVSLPAGSYIFDVSAPAYSVNRHQVRLQNITDGTTVRYGESMYAPATFGGMNRSHAGGSFLIDGAKAFQLQHQCQTTTATNGLGVAGSFASALEVYAVAEFWKVG